MVAMRSGISLSTRFGLMQKHQFKCAYCGKSASEVPLEVDHVLPRSKGGTNALDNLVVSCFDCNRGKRDTVLDETPPTTKQPRSSQKSSLGRGLVGKFFHTFHDDRAVQYQGQVVGEVAGGLYLVRLFEWFTGCSSGERLWPLANLSGAQFYDSDESMRDAYEYQHRFATERHPV